MRLTHCREVHEAKTKRELGPLLRKRDKDGFYSFWLSHDNDTYPVLSILLKDDLACLHYFPQEGDAGLASVGNIGNLKRGDTTIFLLDGVEQMCVLNDAIVPVSAALAAAKEFFATKAPPKSIQWLQL